MTVDLFSGKFDRLYNSNWWHHRRLGEDSKTKKHTCINSVSTKLGGLVLSRRLRKSRQFQKVSLDNRDISILSRHVQKVQKVSIETEKSVETWHFWQILTVFLDLDRELVNVITVLNPDFSICQDFWAWSLEKVLKKSRLCWEIWKILDKSQKSQFVSTILIVSTISINISTKINLDRRISI